MGRVRSRGTVRLRSSNPYSLPRIDPRFLSDKNDFRDFVDSVRFSLKLLERSPLAKYVNPSSIEVEGCPVCNKRYRYECTESIEYYVRYYTSTGSHSCGSCRMGAVQRHDIVVDSFLKVKYVTNLRVCDSSIFPDVPNGNLNSPTTMVAEKCSQMIMT